MALRPRFDMGANSLGQRVSEVLILAVADKIIGYSGRAAKPERVGIDDGRARTQKMIDAAMPDTINSFQRTADGTRLLVTSFSDTKTTRWHILDEAKRTLEEIGAG